MYLKLIFFTVSKIGILLTRFLLYDIIVYIIYSQVTNKMKKKTKTILLIVICLCCFFAAFVFGVDFYVKTKAKSNIMTEEQLQDTENIDCILVLGAGVDNDKPKPMLKDRLDVAISLYKNNISDKLIMSGDHGTKEYDEVNIMKNYAIEQGVPSEDIFMDHAGFSTYESIYRAKDIFCAKKIIVVTQEYHLYRALYIAESFGLEVYGVCADPRRYAGETYREIRELLARNKDFLMCIFKPNPTYLGEIIPVSGNGDITNDKQEV